LGKTFLFAREIAHDIARVQNVTFNNNFDVRYVAGGIKMESVYGQSSSPYSNCISLMMAGEAVQLSTDDDCNEAQWNEAVAHYKANGYPNEESYMDMLGSKFIQLSSDKWVQDQADLDEYLKENK